MNPLTKTSSAWSRLERDLAKLESVVARGVVPGEVSRWCSDVGDVLGDVRRSTASYDQEHRELLRTIEIEDPALDARVRVLNEAWPPMMRRLTLFSESLVSVLEHESARPRSGDEPIAVVEELREGLLGWIVEMRAHRGELETWFDEALYRDRGAKD